MKSLAMIMFENERAATVSAAQLVIALGQDLVGKKIHTPALGNYPGGEAIVTELYHDPEAPDIVLQVYLPGYGEAIVFDYEQVRLAE